MTDYYPPPPMPEPQTLICTVEEFRQLRNERNRYRAALRKISRGSIQDDVLRVPLSHVALRSIADAALKSRSRRSRRK